MKALLCAVAALVLAAPAAHGQTPADPFQWLEDIDAPKSMQWVEGQNARTAGRLEADPRYETFRQQALAIFTAEDRIATPHFRAGGVDNFWQDAAHVHGLWRRTSLASYRSASPSWEPLLDLDALSKAEGKNWIWKGADCLKPAQSLCLVSLSNGGSDAVEVREFDTAVRRFVSAGFHLPEGKQDVAWLDHDTLAVAREWTAGDVTTSGYAYVVKTLTRDGRSKEVFRGEKTDVSATPIALRGQAGRLDGLLIKRGVTFYESEYSLVTDRGLVRLALPRKAEFQTYVDGQLVFTVQQDWQGFKAGALIAYDLSAVLHDAAAAKPRLIFEPGPRQAIQAVASTRDQLVVDLLENVRGAIDASDLSAPR